MRQLLRRAKTKPIVDGQLYYVDASGSEHVIDVRVTTRGKSRLEHCSFPPLSISLNPAQVDATLFAGQSKLKIVTHCRNGSSYLRYLHQEFGIYRAYNSLSEHSFRVRMLNVTYRDSQIERRDDVRPAFFIESTAEVAERLGMTTVKTKSIRPEQLDPGESNIYELFQYMIANTDWSILKSTGTEFCCHNGKVIAKPDAMDDWVVLPYDFDQAGIINTRYALPADELRLRSVRQRLYRGRCRHSDQLDETVKLFNDRRQEIQAALAPHALTDRARRSALGYLETFYTIINDSTKLKKEVISVCRGGRS